MGLLDGEVARASAQDYGVGSATDVVLAGTELTIRPLAQPD
ncbi:MAG: hypothetical protein ACRDWY_08585 [Actinomycetes bacterium]